MWSIRILSGPQAGQIISLKLGKNSFGRGQNCDAKIQSSGISKEHCEIHVYQDKMMIVDLKSSNGTFVNGVKIQNAIIQLGDKLSLFDVIMDVIPSVEVRSKPAAVVQRHSPPSQQNLVASFPLLQQPMYDGANAYQQSPQLQPEINLQSMPLPHFQENSSPQPVAAAGQTLSYYHKIENYLEATLMPAVYKLSILVPFKHVLLGFILIFIIGVTLLSMIPLNTVTKESNYNEAARRAKSVARAMARMNEVALLSGQFGSLNVSDALKEDGIKEAFIIQQTDGSIIAPSEKAGRIASKPFISQARKESKAASGLIDSKTIGATHPIGVYDANTGESTIKYHAIVYYDISSLGVDQGRVMSLFMQTLLIASILGIFLFFIFSRLIQHPLSELNKKIDQALRDKTDRMEVLFDDPEFQKIVANVNLILNRMWSGANDHNIQKIEQNRDLEFINLIDMISQPALVISKTGIVVALNSEFEQLSQMSRQSLFQQNYNTITDLSLMQNIEALIARSFAAPYEKHIDKIPFSQFECRISVQASLSTAGEPDYYIVTLAKIESA